MTRSEFTKTHGQSGLRILRMLFDGYSTQHIATTTRTPRARVAAFAANFTRGAYRALVRTLGWTPRWDSRTREIVSSMRSGQSTDEVARRFGISDRSAAAYMANFTRGSYDQVASS